jgi:hypothetical protein
MACTSTFARKNACNSFILCYLTPVFSAISWGGGGGYGPVPFLPEAGIDLHIFILRALGK